MTHSSDASPEELLAKGPQIVEAVAGGPLRTVKPYTREVRAQIDTELVAKSIDFMVFLGAMSIIGLIVLTVSRDVAVFLVDAGLLFEEFFSRVSRLVIPAFAFVTFYSLIVILFASAYRLISVYTPDPQFYVGGTPHALSFSESIYFSIGTISTVGYGDITPYSSLARVLASLEVFCGIMLLLFGVSELLEYAREHRQHRGSK